MDPDLSQALKNTGFRRFLRLQNTRSGPVNKLTDPETNAEPDPTTLKNSKITISSDFICFYIIEELYVKRVDPH